MLRWLTIVAILCFVNAPPARANIMFIVFFGEGSCAITVIGDAVIAEFADNAKKAGAKHVVVKGNAGKGEGSESSVVELSRCRAEAVRGDLVRHGLDPGVIGVIAKGSSEPLSEYRDGTPEMDRRAQMDITE